MTSESGRHLLEQVVNDVVGESAQVEWVEPSDRWSLMRGFGVPTATSATS